MRLRRLERQCRRLIADIEVPEPFDLSVFLSYVAARRGRDLHLHPQAAPSGSPCGLWLATDQADHIFYAAGADPLHRRHIILHEIGHILCDHQAPGLVLPDLDPSTVARVLLRSTYSAPQEQVAEMIATMISGRVLRGGAAPRTDDPLLQGLQEALIPGPVPGPGHGLR